MLRADGVRVSVSSVGRALRRQALLQPRRYLAERRALAAQRKAVYVAPPTRRNRVWQADFTGTSSARDAIEALDVALGGVERLLGHPLLDVCLDPAGGALHPCVIVTDNGPAFKSAGFVHSS